MKLPYAVTLTVIAATAVAGFFMPVYLALTALALVVLAHQHALAVMDESLEDRIKAILKSEHGADWQFLRDTVKQHVEILNARGSNERNSRTTPYRPGSH